MRRSPSLGSIVVEVQQPYDPAQPARLEFRFPDTEGLGLWGGGVHGDGGKQGEWGSEVELIAGVLGEAVQRPRRMRGPLQELEQELGPLLDGTPFGRAFGALDPFLGGLRGLVEELERMGRGAF